MTANPLLQAHRVHRWYDRVLLDIQRRAFGPRGVLRSGERRWRALVLQGLAEGGVEGALRAHNEAATDILAQLRGLLLRARGAGQGMAQRQLRAFGVDLGAGPEQRHEERAHSVENQALQVLQARLMLVRNQLRAIAYQSGGDERALRDRLERYHGIWGARYDLAFFLPAVAAVWVQVWLDWAFWGGWLPPVKGGDWAKQAVATIDHRTTETCLLVHGQVQPWEKPFVLKGEPRFADRMDWSPFHWHCRTSVVLYHPAYDDGLTERMRAEADMELQARKRGGSAHYPPSSALGG